LSSCFDAANGRWTATASADESFGLAPWLTVALVLHGAIALAHHASPKVDAVAPAPLEVDLAPPTHKPPPEPPPPIDEPAAPAAPARPERHAARHAVAEPTRAPARAGNVLTAGEASEAGDPVSFVTDPEGRNYGGGVVARGGLAETTPEPVRPAASGRPGPPSPGPEPLTPAADLGRRPKLAEDDPCRGFFPTRADRDEGHVTLTVVVQPTGAVGAVTVLTESPAGEGFGDAARRCLAAQRFVPALDRAGQATRTATQVRIHFTR
jgi:periplasmic protein TonB